MRKFTKQFYRVFMQTIAMVLLSAVAFAQTAVSGRVTDSKDGTAVAGATVTVKGAKVATKTGADGTFTISVPANATLIITSVGFGSREVAVGGKTSLDVSLVQSNQQLNEVVVVAYGTKRKGDLTGAVTSVSAKEFQKGAIASAEQLLQGKVAGLQITNGGGSPGGGSRLRIRGASSLNASNDPLIVIDGIPVEGNSINGGGNLLNSLNPNDIESMTVLKDASATALYGSRATNGVLIITTKKGTKGKVKFNYNTNLSLGVVAKKIDVFTGDEIRSIVNAEAVKSGSNGYKNLLGTANTDWQNEIYQKAFGYDNNISASGAAFKNKLPFRISAGYLTQDGILLTDNFKRASAGLNLSPKFFNDHLSVNFNFKYGNTKYKHANGDAVGAAASFDPTQAVNATNKFGGYFEWLDALGKPLGTNGNASNPNPLSLLKFRNNNEIINRVLTNVQLDYKLHFLPDVHVLANLGIDATSQNGNDNIDSILVTNQTTAGSYTKYKQNKKNTLAEISLSYAKELKSIKSKFDVLIGHGYQAFVTDVYNYRSYKQSGDTIPKTTAPEFPTDKQENRIESYFGRLNFSVDNKYLLTASLRRDASSRFSKENRVGYFPSVAAAWKLKEDFFANSNVVSELKLRLGWGVTGQQDGIGNYGYLANYSLGTATAQYQFGNNFYYVYRPRPYYPNLKWETTTTQNAGLDFAFLNNRISGSVEIYNKKTKDLLSVVDQAPGQNFDISLLRNIGNLENNGVEFTLNTTPVKKANLTWDFGFNITAQHSEITKLTAINDPSFPGIDVEGISGGTGNKIAKHQVGYTPYTYYMKQQVYDATTGKAIEGLYEDANRNGASDDQYYNSKSAAPSLLFGINTQVNYLKWSLGMAAHGSYNNYLYNNFASRAGVLNAIQNGSLITNGSRDYLNTGFRNQQFLSDYYLQNASFLRLDNINVGYNLGKIYHNKASLRLSGSVQNVFVITKYKGLDPENSGNGVDNNIYPRPRVFSLSANLDF
jgi:TonB-dependent starch-binding outer membrane protein SusC